ncbi:MAG TPA: hypothetical protein VM580_05545 [Labilithrix sp.]|nr:hypothetical protein [Labilithrix sp.]
MNRLSSVAPLFAAIALFATGCGDASAPTSTLAEHYQRLGNEFGSALARVKSSATTAGSFVPADLASVAKLPKEVTGGVDISTAQAGKVGERAVNIDGLGADETVKAFVPDPPTGGTGTTVSLPAFGGWRGDAESNDAGRCYLGWTKGASWFVVSKCGDTSGAWVCQVTSSTATCEACDTAGTCKPCDMGQADFTCAWP